MDMLWGLGESATVILLMEAKDVLVLLCMEFGAFNDGIGARVIMIVHII